MQKLIILDNIVIAVLSDGHTFERSDLSKEQINQLTTAESDSEVMHIMDSKYSKAIEEVRKIEKLEKDIENSMYLTKVDDSVYWKEISELSMPKELVEAILTAERTEDSIKLETYKNFWTLMSLNPDEECRNNLFWFLNRNGLVISRCGFFVAYRNADSTKEVGVFTDHHSHKFNITIGEIVSMPRSKCDCDSNVTCSRGLHLGARTWLKRNYFGDTGLVCLCNPADVVAVPHQDYYGKLRTCAYIPIDYATFDDEGDVIPYNVEDGFECPYVHHVIYEGLMGTEEETAYKIKIPDIPGISEENITARLLDIARESISRRKE